MKRCSKCRAEKPVTEFCKNRAMKDGLQNQCRACMQAYKLEHPDRVAAAAKKLYHRYKAEGRMADEKRCPRCKTVKAADQFHRAQGSPNGLHTYCKVCTRDDTARWYSENSERSLAANRRWRAENYERLRANWAAYRSTHLEEHNEAGRRRHARKKSTDHGCVTVDKLTELFDRHRERCAYCYEPITRRTMQWDHITPLALGGPHCIENLAPSCTPCNASKNKAPLGEWLAKRGVLF